MSEEPSLPNVEDFRSLSEAHLRARRFLVTYAGLLVLFCFNGISLISDTEANITVVSLFGLHFEDTQKLRWVLFVLTLYGFSQYALSWIGEATHVRLSPISETDRLITLSIFSFSVLYFFISSREFVSGEILGAILFFSLFYIVRLLAFFMDWLATVVEGDSLKAERDLSQVLLRSGGNWTLLFDPINNREKRLQFLNGGMIVNLENQPTGLANEHRWQLKGGLLEILDLDGFVFSRFAYSKADDRFIHTNDGDTKSLRNQVLYRH